MHRLLVPTGVLNGDRAQLPDDARRHLRVLRPKAGETLELFDGAGRTRTYAHSEAGLTATGPVSVFPPRTGGLTLFACVTKGSRWDWTIEKAVELGVSRIVPVISERTIVRLAPAERPAKAARWRRIAEDAARQSDAVYLPEIREAVDFANTPALVRACDRVFVGALATPPPPSLFSEAVRLAHDAPPSGDWGVYIGPEGDFTPDELATLFAIATPVSLGPTILRAETAAIYAVSVLAAARC